MTIRRVEFIVTYLCNSRCKHCQLSDDRTGFPNHINRDLAVDIIRKVSKHHRPKSIMTFGGEPMLFPEVVYAIHREALRVGISSRELITNGSWSGRRELIEQMASSLSNSGVNEVDFSVDCFHQEFIPIQRVRVAAESLLRAGIRRIEWNPCWLISKDHDNDYNTKTKAILNVLSDLSVARGEGNVMRAEGRATKNLEGFFQRKTTLPEGKCGEIPYTEKLDSVRGICIEPDGRVAVCNQFYIGNASQTDIIELLENYDPYEIPEAKAIIEGGMEGLLNWAKKKGVMPDPKGYYSICDMCTSIRAEANKKHEMMAGR